jgi:cobalt/nickel transport system permease protein
MAMLSRGFNGAFPARQNDRFGAREAGFLLGWSALFLLLRLENLPRLLGTAVLGVLP